MNDQDQPRFFPAQTSTYKPYGSDVVYHMVSSEITTHGFAKKRHDSVFRAVIKRVDGLSVTTHEIYVGVDNMMRSSTLLQDQKQAHADDLLRTAMTGYTGRKSDERF